MNCLIWLLELFDVICRTGLDMAVVGVELWP